MRALCVSLSLVGCSPTLLWSTGKGTTKLSGNTPPEEEPSHVLPALQALHHLIPYKEEADTKLTNLLKVIHPIEVLRSRFKLTLEPELPTIVSVYKIFL